MICGTWWKRMAPLYHLPTLPVVEIHDHVLELHHPVVAPPLRHGLAVHTVVVAITVMMIAETGVVMMIEVGAVMIAGAMETGAVMTIGAVMTVEVTVEMIAVEMMVVVAVLMDAVQTASLLG
jgi:hypothetical protein